MPETISAFLNTARQVMSDKAFNERFSKAKENYHTHHQAALRQFADLATARNRATHNRWKTIESLDKYLIEFESNVIKNKGKVLWAVDAKQALGEIESVINKNRGLKIENNTGFVGREIGLGAWLSQKFNSSPGPKTIRQVEENITTAHFSNLFLNGGFDKAESALKEAFPGLSFNEAFVSSEKTETDSHDNNSIGFSEALFICADTGSVVTGGTGKSSLVPCTGKIQVVLASVDCILPSLNDLDLMLPLVSTYKNGQEHLPCYAITNSPQKENETEGPDELYILLIDNGRSDVIAKESQRQAMHCIKCGACQYACPVYETVGSKPFNHIYSGPIASMALPYLENFEDHQYLSLASTLCGTYEQVCPVNIDFKKGILDNRRQGVKKKLHSSNDKWFFYLWKKTMMKRDFINLKGINPRKRIAETLFLKSPENLRIMPPIAPKTFNEQWRERTGQK